MLIWDARPIQMIVTGLPAAAKDTREAAIRLQSAGHSDKKVTSVY